MRETGSIREWTSPRGHNGHKCTLPRSGDPRSHDIGNCSDYVLAKAGEPCRWVHLTICWGYLRPFLEFLKNGRWGDLAVLCRYSWLAVGFQNDPVGMLMTLSYLCVFQVWHWYGPCWITGNWRQTGVLFRGNCFSLLAWSIPERIIIRREKVGKEKGPKYWPNLYRPENPRFLGRYVISVQ